jgi:hypothetical protein
MTPEERAEKDRMERILKQRIDAQFGGTAGKVKFNQGLKGKHKMTRNTKALPAWGDLQGRHQGAFLGILVGVLAGIMITLALRDAEWFIKLVGETAAEWLPFILGVLVVMMMGGMGFVLGRATEK